MIGAIERLFNDFIGSFVPGFVLIVALEWMTPIAFGNYGFGFAGSDPSFLWLILIVAAYAAGHLIDSVGLLITRILNLRWLTYVIPYYQTRTMLDAKIESTPGFAILREECQHSLRHELFETQSIRNIALSLPWVDSPTVLRFRFLSLLHLGLATVTAIVIAGSTLLHVSLIFTPASYSLMIMSYHGFRFFGGISILVALLIWILLMSRYYRFNAISMHLPIEMAATTFLTRNIGPSSS